MGSYRSDDEALIGLARQLTDAYGEARTREDQDFACESIAEFLSEFRESAPSEALLALLDLPLTAETYPLVDEAQVALAARGPGVVELLLEALLGDVYDPDGPAPERAAETLDQLPPGEAALGLTEVLCGRGGDDLKGAAVDGLVALGALAEPDIVATLDDPEGGDWARAALEQIRFGREHPGAGDEDLDAGDQDFPGEPGDEVAGEEDETDEHAVEPEPGPEGETEAEPELEAEPVAADEGAEAQVTVRDEPDQAPASGEAAGPDLGLVDDAYQDFLKRFEQDAGDEPSSP